jgi:tripartite ATP-independent transporter DctM subunit
MNVAFITILFFGSMLILLATGLPLSFSLGGIAVVFAYFLWGPGSLLVVASTVYGYMTNFILVAIAMFIFMGVMLEYSGVADNLYRMMHRWMGSIRGGLAAGTVIICMLFAAMTGISAAGTITMGVVALPEMLKRNYKPTIAMGSISAGGALGSLIPPSAIMIIYGVMTDLSVGKLFAAGIIPGTLLGVLFIVYILIHSFLNLELAPALPAGERATWKEKIVSLKSVILPILLIFSVLGSIFTGVATPTEASAIGALGSIVCAAVNRRLSWDVVKKTSYQTTQLTVMAMWILLGAATFTTVYNAIGAPALIKGFLTSLPVGPFGIIIAMQFSFFILGMFLDPIGITMITIPIYAPIVVSLGFDPLWFGTVFVVNLEMAYLTPPFGFNLFYMKAVAPDNITMTQIYKAMLPFIILQMIGLIIVIVFPQLILWLPNILIK